MSILGALLGMISTHTSRAAYSGPQVDHKAGSYNNASFQDESISGNP